MRRLLLLSLLWCCHFEFAAAAVPEPLQPWREWVVEDHPTLGCPLAWSGLKEPICAWPGRLGVDADDRGARVVQHWQVYREEWVYLPGSERYWPQRVTVNGQPQALAEHEGRPALRLAAGAYEIKAELEWAAIPQVLALPPFTGLVSLKLRGETQARAVFTADNQLLFAPAPVASGAPAQADSESLRVYNKLSDGLPLLLESRLRLSVSGSDRELLLGRWLPEGAELTELVSELPARIEPDGRLRVQARVGEWELELHARFVGDRREFAMRRLDPNWPAQEIWSFEAAPAVRGVKLGGATAVDPAQVESPEEWRSLPAYLLDEHNTLVLEQVYRGDTKPRADELSLQRDLWLDFDGSGFTARDVLSGTVYRGWRLRGDPGTRLGRASIDGEPQLITRLPGENADGIELRSRTVTLEAVSRIDRSASVPALGWQHGVNSLRAVVHLPPGWRLWHARGVDSVSSSWLSRWDLWDIFLVLITVVTTLRLLDWRAAVLALLVFAFGYHEAAGLLWLWLGMLIAGLVRQLGLPRGWGVAARSLHGVLGIALVLALLGYAVHLVRVSIYPQLEMQQAINQQDGGIAQERGFALGRADVANAVPKPKPELAPPSMAIMSNAQVGLTAGEMVVVTAQKRNRQEFDASARIQTGPGEPEWRWRAVALDWSGPVTTEQDIGLVLTSPAWTRLINLAQLLLWAALLTLLVRRLPGVAQRSAALLLLVIVAGVGGENARAEGFPDKALLDQLEQRLTRVPRCEPQCASIANAQLRISDGGLSLRLRIDALADVYVPLPSSRDGWQPQQVLLDGNETAALAHAGGRLQLALTRGQHDVVLNGPTGTDHIDLPFGMPAHAISVSAEGWSVSGVQEGRVPGGVVQLQRTQRQQTHDRVLQADAIAPFVLIQRSLHFNNQWSVATRIQRLAPEHGAINLEVPLLPGEAVTGSEFKTVDGRLQVVMAAAADEVEWSSQIAVTDELRLQSLTQPMYVERWQLFPSPQWHLDWQGLAPVKDQDMTFFPWPGEEMRIRVSRPAPVDGPVQTIESLLLKSSPGQRAADHSLQISLRASQAGEYRLQLPEGAAVQSLSVDGAELDTEDRRDVVLPVHPGVQQLEVVWRESAAMGWRWIAPALMLSTPPANLSWQVTVPQDRWLLWVSGPAIGPALLYWGVLVVIIAVATLLGRLPRWWPAAPPLTGLQWALLGIGMSTANQVGSVVVVAWLFALALRGRGGPNVSRRLFNLLQILLAVLTLVALLVLLGTIPASLLSSPDMQATGNGSYGNWLQWYQDRSAPTIAQPVILSLPLWCYRVVMLAWSLWLAWKLLDWLRWGWRCFGAGELWRSPDRVVANSVAESK